MLPGVKVVIQGGERYGAVEEGGEVMLRSTLTFEKSQQPLHPLQLT